MPGCPDLELISSLPDGLDTVAGDRGYRFSGGEKQRLALARLLLKAPSVVVLDEAAAHLDSESESWTGGRSPNAGRTRNCSPLAGRTRGCTGHNSRRRQRYGRSWSLIPMVMALSPQHY